MEFVKDRFVQAVIERFDGVAFYEGHFWDRWLSFRLDDGGLMSVFDYNFVDIELHIGKHYDLQLDMFLPRFVGLETNAINDLAASYLWKAVQISSGDIAEAWKAITTDASVPRFELRQNNALLATSVGLVLMDTQEISDEVSGNDGILRWYAGRIDLVGTAKSA